MTEDKKKPARLFAIVKSDCQIPLIVAAHTQAELKAQLEDPNLEILAIFRGRQLQTKQKRQLSFSV